MVTIEASTGRCRLWRLQERRAAAIHPPVWSRSVAQPGSAHRSGRWGRRFKSCHSDQNLHCTAIPETWVPVVPKTWVTTSCRTGCRWSARFSARGRYIRDHNEWFCYGHVPLERAQGLLPVVRFLVSNSREAGGLASWQTKGRLSAWQKLGCPGGHGRGLLGLGPPVGDTLGRRRRPDGRGGRRRTYRHRVCGSLPRRGGRTPDWRTVRHARPGRRRDGDRGGTDRLGHGRSSQRRRPDWRGTRFSPPS